MAWNLDEAIAYYRRQGAPGDQTALTALLKEIQQEQGGIPKYMVEQAAAACGVKEALLLALIRRIPSLRLADTHVLEICCGANCPKKRDLAGLAEKIRDGRQGNVEIRHVPCMRLCGKGPNIRWDGKVYHQADEALLRELLKNG